jgi:hypothetical protein
MTDTAIFIAMIALQSVPVKASWPPVMGPRPGYRP